MIEHTETAVDPDDFVGEPPAGDANPGDFMSNDQSAPSPDGASADEDAS